MPRRDIDCDQYNSPNNINLFKSRAAPRQVTSSRFDYIADLYRIPDSSFASCTKEGLSTVQAWLTFLIRSERSFRPRKVIRTKHRTIFIRCGKYFDGHRQLSLFQGLAGIEVWDLCRVMCGANGVVRGNSWPAESQ